MKEEVKEVKEAVKAEAVKAEVNPFQARAAAMKAACQSFGAEKSVVIAQKQELQDCFGVTTADEVGMALGSHGGRWMLPVLGATESNGREIYLELPEMVDCHHRVKVSHLASPGQESPWMKMRKSAEYTAGVVEFYVGELGDNDREPSKEYKLIPGNPHGRWGQTYEGKFLLRPQSLKAADMQSKPVERQFRQRGQQQTANSVVNF